MLHDYFLKLKSSNNVYTLSNKITVTITEKKEQMFIIGTWVLRVIYKNHPYSRVFQHYMSIYVG